jgi:hypothetical protein
MKTKSIKLTYVFCLFLFIGLLTSCGSPPTLCDCLTTGGDLPSGCEQVFKDNYGTTDPSLKQMKNDYNNCK